MWTRLVAHVFGAAEIQVSGRWFLAEDMDAALCRQAGCQTAVDATCERASLMAGEAAEEQKTGTISSRLRQERNTAFIEYSTTQQRGQRPPQSQPLPPPPSSA